MEALHAVLLGRFDIRCGDRLLAFKRPTKVRELLAYLLIYRDEPQGRDRLASLLWGETATSARARKYLRDTIWRLQVGLDYCGAPEGILRADKETIEIQSSDKIWLDVAIVESAYQMTKSIPEQAMDRTVAHHVADAISLYTNDLLQDWDADWCSFERARLHRHYVLMARKLAAYYELACQYEDGLLIAEQLISNDRADEQAHQMLMRLHYRMGDRTGALRQFKRCVDALRSELDLPPSDDTLEMIEAIRQGTLPAYAA